MRKFIFISFFLLLCSQIFAQSKVINTYQNPVISKDFPDPSIIRVGDVWYAVGTSSEWAPYFPIMKSTDLVNWETIGSVFKNKTDLAEGNFWAPEFYQENGEYYVFYSARRKDKGGMCIGVASSQNPAGPYKDGGVFLCDANGSIDPYLFKDDDGKYYMIWKEDANSKNLPVTIWAQEFDLLKYKLLGEKFKLISNTETWEGTLVEAPCLVKKNGYYYLFYSAQGCCGQWCKYAMGVARSMSIKGNWEKYKSNPIVSENRFFKCAGHGTITDDAKGRNFMLYHAYNQLSGVSMGRQAVLDEIIWTEDNWVSLKFSQSPTAQAPVPFEGTIQKSVSDYEENFSNTELPLVWQTDFRNKPDYKLDSKNGGILLMADTNEGDSSSMAGSVMGISPDAATFKFSTALTLDSTLKEVTRGLVYYGDSANFIALCYTNKQLELWRVVGNKKQIVQAAKLSAPFQNLHLQLTVTNGNRVKAFWSGDDVNWYKFYPIDANGYLSAEGLAPWDRGMRAGFMVKNKVEKSGIFEYFKIQYSN